MCTSCETKIDQSLSDNYYYNWNKTKIIFNDHGAWNYKCTVNCDMETFQIIRELWAKDKNFVFFKGEARKNIDLATFYFDSNGLPKDDKYVYTTQWGSPVRNTMLFWEGADPKTFELIKLNDGYADVWKLYLWGKDSKNYFRSLEVMDCDYETFEIIDSHHAKDKNNVYYEYKIIANADPKTFRFDSIKNSYVDDKYEYRAGKVIEKSKNRVNF